MVRAWRNLRSKRWLFSALLLCGAAAVAAEKIDLNRADGEALASLPGIGPVRAQDIIDYRESHGPIEYWDELLEIDGLGEKTLEKIRAHSSLTGGITQLAPEADREKKSKKKKRKKSGVTKAQSDGDKDEKTARDKAEKESVTIPGYRYEDIYN